MKEELAVTLDRAQMEEDILNEASLYTITNQGK